MTALHLYSEPFAKTGNIAAEGSRRLLGRPPLGPLQTVLREGIQNILDAAKGTSGPKVLLRLRTLTPAQHEALADRVFKDLPKADDTRDEMAQSLGKTALRVLELCDFDTEGLSGPTSADVAHTGSERLNFVNFLRNVGAARDTPHGGGTYGYGKSSLYAMSACSTIVVDSQTTCTGQPVRRFMACHLGVAFDADTAQGPKRFTGRHWWGVLDEEESIDPAVGSLAGELAEQLGMPRRLASDTGTSILILDPLLNGTSLELAAKEIVEVLLWNFWPRMTATTPSAKQLGIRFELEGAEVAIPRPEEFPPLDLFASAMADLRAGGAHTQIVKCGNPKRDLGKLAINRGVVAQRHPTANRAGSAIPEQASHIALMRPVELVVKYLKGDPFPDKRFEWAGVFVCSGDSDIEAAFASAEPPAHDDWIPENLPSGTRKRFVNVAMRELNLAARSIANPTTPASSSEQGGPSLAATATKLGILLGSVSTTGPGRKKGVGKPPSPKKSLSVSPATFVGLRASTSGQRIAIFRADVTNDRSDSQLIVRARPHLVIDGASTGLDDLPSGYESSVILMTLGTAKSNASILEIGHMAGPLEVHVAMPSDAAVGVGLTLHSGAEK